MDTPLENSVSKDERTWAMVAHLSAFSMYLSGIGHLVGPLIVWLVKREGNSFVDDQGKEALNFQISISIYALAGVVLCMTLILAVIGIPLLIGLGIFQVIFVIIAAIKASDGVAYRYPLCLRLIK